ncbi:hypothetical protein [Nitrosospira briensis]|uniref:hypothetical protein n=1 Tax=Nitrosospira briensis TaxID=35799 RepID=UPI000467F7B3|nr:hypothetical protein [Nitrosospira briensis]
MKLFPKQRPVYRVQKALKRLSREKWICGGEINDMCMKLSKLAAPVGWGNVASHAMRYDCVFVGMWNGEPPARRGIDPYYPEMLRALKGRNTKSDASTELLILEIKLRSKNHAG